MKKEASPLLGQCAMPAIANRDQNEHAYLVSDRALSRKARDCADDWKARSVRFAQAEGSVI
jgi:hypothetical protein